MAVRCLGHISSGKWFIRKRLHFSMRVVSVKCSPAFLVLFLLYTLSPQACGVKYRHYSTVIVINIIIIISSIINILFFIIVIIDHLNIIIIITRSLSLMIFCGSFTFRWCDL